MIVFLVIILVIGLMGLRTINQFEEGLLFTLGKFSGVKKPGLTWIFPLIHRLVKVDLRILTKDIPRQEIISSDNVSIHVDAVLWYKVENPEWAIIKVEDYNFAVNQLAMTTLRDVLGQHTLDSILKERDTIAKSLQEIIEKATENWGVNVSRVEIKSVEIPESMKRMMAQEAEATREKKARIIKAEGELEAAKKLREAAEEMSLNPMSLELRRMQMMTEIGAEQNTSTIVLMPSEFLGIANALNKLKDK